MTDPLIESLERSLAARDAAGLGRRRRVVESRAGPRAVIDGRELVSFAGNDYLGLAGEPSLAEAAAVAARRWGVGATASHLLCGHYAPHEALEREIAEWVAPCAGARAVTFSTGYLANLAIVSALADRETEVFADRLNHACLNDGALLARSRLVRYAHGDAGALAGRLASSDRRPVRRRGSSEEPAKPVPPRPITPYPRMCHIRRFVRISRRQSRRGAGRRLPRRVRIRDRRTSATSPRAV